ncbi:hypothetical protein [Vibrio sonorensis]|uniref:hypothetical protein n=1 Tax=Vibrio sonorensis TaxID=1004316 RepID=UPI001113B209|nr:hypothetical protein [Vibrio sonorensis]
MIEIEYSNLHNKTHHPYENDINMIRENSHNRCSSGSLSTSKKLNIAICVSGQLRGWKKALKSWKNLGLEGHNVTTIVHVWKGTGVTVPIPPKDERSLPENFQKAYREVWNKLGAEKMYSRYSNFFSLWGANETNVTYENLSKAYQSTQVTIEDDSVKPFVGMTNAEKMYYKISKCQEACDSLDLTFDLIIRIRPDLEFTSDKKLDWNEVYRSSHMDNILYCESYTRYLFPNIGFSMTDHFAIASPTAMRAYTLAYEMTKKLSDKQTLFPKNLMAHTNVAYSTLYNGINIESVSLPCVLSPSYAPTSAMIKKALEADSKDRNDSFDRLLIKSLT